MIKLLGIPFDANSSFSRGPAKAPDRIRAQEAGGSANMWAEGGRLIEPGNTYQDLGDITFESDDPAQAFDRIKKEVRKSIDDGAKLVSLGGDHSVTYPILAAFTEVFPDLHVLHIDAHGDLYDNFENNPFSHASPFARIMEQGKLASLTQVGIRTLNDHQRQQADRFGVRIIEMKDYKLMELNNLNGPLYISLDLDALDPAYAPGVSHHEPGGLTTRQVLEIIQRIRVPVVGGDVVECNPERDVNDVTAMVGYKMMKEVMASMLRP